MKVGARLSSKVIEKDKVGREKSLADYGISLRFYVLGGLRAV
jgi:hypothetical protein